MKLIPSRSEIPKLKPLGWRLWVVLDSLLPLLSFPFARFRREAHNRGQALFMG